MRTVGTALKDAQKSGLKVGVVGYCFGGTMAWLAATRIDGVAAAIAYYGGGVADAAAEKPKSPVIFHWGETDASIPKEHWEKVKQQHPNLTQYVYPAGHGFHCDERASYHKPSAHPAKGRTLPVLKQHVG